MQQLRWVQVYKMQFNQQYLFFKHIFSSYLLYQKIGESISASDSLRQRNYTGKLNKNSSILVYLHFFNSFLYQIVMAYPHNKH